MGLGETDEVKARMRLHERPKGRQPIAETGTHLRDARLEVREDILCDRRLAAQQRVAQREQVKAPRRELIPKCRARLEGACAGGGCHNESGGGGVFLAMSMLHLGCERA